VPFLLTISFTSVNFEEARNLSVHNFWRPNFYSQLRDWFLDAYFILSSVSHRHDAL